MAKTVAVIQSNYIPWKGYFDIINDVDFFIFYDDLQYTKNDWRNRNLVKTPNGVEWISVPVGSKTNRLICEVRIENAFWAKKHWGTIQTNYRKARYFSLLKPFLEDLYLHRKWDSLSELNQYVIKAIAVDFLGIKTEFADSRDFKPEGKKLDRLLDLLIKVGTTRYVSGPSAKFYIDEQRFKKEGIELVWKDYSAYPEYEQFYPPFVHGVTILDLLFHAGTAAPRYIWGHRNV